MHTCTHHHQHTKTQNHKKKKVVQEGKEGKQGRRQGMNAELKEEHNE